MSKIEAFALNLLVSCLAVEFTLIIAITIAKITGVIQ